MKVNNELSNLFEINPAEIVFLCGAGISLDYPSKLPTVYKFVIDSLKESNISGEIIKKVDTQFWLTNYRFESLIDQIHKVVDKNMAVTNLFNSQTYNHIHSFLAQMLMKGSSIITTNFDTCIENVIFKNKINYDFKNYIVYKGGDLLNIPNIKSNYLIKIHGSQPSKANLDVELVTTIRALAKTSKGFSLLPNWKQFIIDIIENKTIVVLGYSCSDDFDVVPLLKLTHPLNVFWINFDYKNEFPIQSFNIKNKNISELNKILPLKFFNGQLIPSIREWSNQQNLLFIEGEKIDPYTINRYVNEVYPNFIDKMIYCNEILLNFSVYEDLFTNSDNSIILLQDIKSKFRLGNYNLTIKQCKNLLNSTQEKWIILETLYYYSSALYFTKDYYNAVEIAKECLELSKENDDMFTYLNMFMNYNSILYVYLWNINDKKGVQKVVKNYLDILSLSQGINLEAEANALWGLGDFYRCTGNIKKAKEYFDQSRVLLLQIGNVFAIKQLDELIYSMIHHEIKQ